MQSPSTVMWYVPRHTQTQEDELALEVANTRHTPYYTHGNRAVVSDPTAYLTPRRFLFGQRMSSWKHTSTPHHHTSKP
jgi:hypothetical protein